MTLQNLPEVRWADLLDSIGAFDVDTSGDSYQKQISFFDEDRIDSNERAILVRRDRENPSNGDQYEDVAILMVFVGKETKGDGINVNLFAKDIQSKLLEVDQYQDIFGIIDMGMNGPIILESGRHAFELRFQMKSNYCPVY